MARRPAVPLQPPGAPLSGFAPGALAHAPDATLVTSFDFRIVEANESAARLLGRPAESLIGVPIDRLMAPSEFALVVEHAARVRRGVPQRYEIRIAGAHDEPCVFAVAAAPLLRDGQVAGITWTLTDITAQAQAYETLARSEARYRQLFEGASDAIMTFDAAACFTTINSAAEVISGYRREELVGTLFAPLIPPEELEKAFHEFQRALNGDKGHFETQFIRKDGEVRSIDVTASCVKPGEEVLCIIRDITEQRRLQQQLIQSEKMGAIGQLVSGVAHELNNPLASISAFAQLLLADRTLPSQHSHSAEIIAGESRRAARIVSNLLTFARQHKAEKVPANINKVLEDTLELRGYELRVRGIDVQPEFDPRLPETMADVYQLQQVFLNLLTNAEQAMASVERPQHRLTLRTRTLPEALRVEIEDTGTGIPAESLQRIFNPFYTTKPPGRGTGLGLSISLGIISEHGGRIWAENVLGGGSRFCVELPRVEAVRRGDDGQPPETVVVAPGLRVLVVDDEEPLRLALAIWLRSAGHQVMTAESGAEALARARESELDAILLDIRMPDFSGQQLFERLRAERPAVAERIIFLTGDTVSADLRGFLDSSGQPYLAKPFDFAEVARVLTKVGPGE